jgi:hypothetical protein
VWIIYNCRVRSNWITVADFYVTWKGFSCRICSTLKPTSRDYVLWLRHGRTTVISSNVYNSRNPSGTYCFSKTMCLKKDDKLQKMFPLERSSRLLINLFIFRKIGIECEKVISMRVIENWFIEKYVPLVHTIQWKAFIFVYQELLTAVPKIFT